MAGIFLLVVKFALLFVLYLFIYRVFKLIWLDVHHLSEENLAPLPASAGAELVITESNDPLLRIGDVLKLGQTSTTIGRGKDNNIDLGDSFVSHNHARLLYKKDDFYLEDLGSINGTYVNGVRVKTPVVLQHGDSIKIAGIVLKFARWKYEVE